MSLPLRLCILLFFLFYFFSWWYFLKYNLCRKLAGVVLVVWFLIRFSLYYMWLNQRITIAELHQNEWFKKGYIPTRFEQVDATLDDVDAIFDESGVRILFFVFGKCFRGGVGIGWVNAHDFASRILETLLSNGEKKGLYYLLPWMPLILSQHLRVSTSVVCSRSKWYVTAVYIQLTMR